MSFPELDWPTIYEQLTPLLNTGASVDEIFATMREAVETQIRQQGAN